MDTNNITVTVIITLVCMITTLVVTILVLIIKLTAVYTRLETNVVILINEVTALRPLKHEYNGIQQRQIAFENNVKSDVDDIKVDIREIRKKIEAIELRGH